MSDYMKFDVKTTISIPSNRVTDLMITAMEGGSNYWIEYCEKIRMTAMHDPAMNWYEDPAVMESERTIIAFHVIDGEEEPVPTFDGRKSVAAALQAMADHYPHLWADVMNENEDASAGDVFLQLAVLGEVVYG